MDCFPFSLFPEKCDSKHCEIFDKCCWRPGPGKCIDIRKAHIANQIQEPAES